MGNGRIGATPDGGVFHENVVLNDVTLWYGGKQDADLKDAYNYLPRIQSHIFSGQNIEAEKLMGKYFICAGAGSGEGNGSNVPYGSYQILANLSLKFKYPTAA